MERFRVRFEQARGHYLVVEGDPPLSRAECDEFQIRMLQTCEVPGLLKLETETIDGQLSLRYALSGTRMLAQAMRTDKWSMKDFMEALCRLAEVMADCRLYVLDDENLLLDDERIFVGSGSRDLRFVYVPAADVRDKNRTGMRTLLVRWMTYVAELEGTVAQQLLRMSNSPDFTPAMLRSYARRYLAEQPSKAMDALMLVHQQPMHAAVIEPIIQQPHSSEEQPGAASGWRWFQPSAAEAHSLSGLLGDDSEPPADEDIPSMHAPLAAGRLRIWAACTAALLSAVAWRWGYAMNPGRQSLLFSIGVTLLAGAGTAIVWRRMNAGREEPVNKASRMPAAEQPGAASGNFGVRRTLSSPPTQHTERLSWESDRTEQLDPLEGHAAKPSYPYLVWETAPAAPNVALDRPSLIIGRSGEASGHVDESHGVSRAHVELLRTREGWTVKDLGSRNGSKLNEEQMVPYEPYVLRDDDRIELAGSRYRFKSPDRKLVDAIG